MDEFWNKVKALEEVETGKAQPLFHTYPVINIYREEERAEALPREKKKIELTVEGQVLPVFEDKVQDDSYENCPATVVKRLLEAGVELKTGDWDLGLRSGFLIGMEGNAAFTSTCKYSGAIVLKPTAGLISRYGLDVVFPSLDGVALGAAEMDILAELLEVTAGVDEKDPWSKDAYVYDFSSAMTEGWKGMKLAVPAGCKEGLKDKEEYEAWLSWLAFQGIELCEEELTWKEYYDTVHQVVFYTEAAAYFDGRTEEPAYQEYAAIGNELLKPENYERYYLKALKIKSLIKDELDLLLRDYDGIFMPEAVDAEENGLLAANLCGLPFLTYPGRNAVSIIGGANQEKKLIRIGQALEKRREVRR